VDFHIQISSNALQRHIVTRGSAVPHPASDPTFRSGSLPTNLLLGRQTSIAKSLRSEHVQVGEAHPNNCPEITTRILFQARPTNHLCSSNGGAFDTKINTFNRVYFFRLYSRMQNQLQMPRRNYIKEHIYMIPIIK